jgi:hypothetical protein
MGAMDVISRRSATFSGISGRSREWWANLRVHGVVQNLHERLQGISMLQTGYARTGQDRCKTPHDG